METYFKILEELFFQVMFDHSYWPEGILTNDHVCRFNARHTLCFIFANIKI